MPRILLIDDTPEIAELADVRACATVGYEVFATGFTTSVNELLAEQRADALVLDCSTFDMSESLFDSVRHHPDHAELPVVIISDTPEAADASLRSRNARSVLLVPKTLHRSAGRGSARRAAAINMPLWSMDEWQYIEREVVTDPKGKQWTVALMDVLGQAGRS